MTYATIHTIAERLRAAVIAEEKALKEAREAYYIAAPEDPDLPQSPDAPELFARYQEASATLRATERALEDFLSHGWH